MSLPSNMQLHDLSTLRKGKSFLQRKNVQTYFEKAHLARGYKLLLSVLLHLPGKKEWFK